MENNSVSLINKLKEDMTLKKIFEIIFSYEQNVASEFSLEDGIKRITYEECKKSIISVSHAISLTLGGLYRGRYIGLKVPASPEWQVLFWSILMAGCKPVLIDPNATDDMALHILNECNAVALISHSKGKLDKNIINIDAETILESYYPEEYEESWEDEFALCTQGTTGFPKVVVYNGESIANQIINIEYIRKQKGGFLPDKEVKALAILQFSNIFGLIGVYLWNSFYGKTIVYVGKKPNEGIYEVCKNHGVTHIYASPSFVKDTYEYTRKMMSKIKDTEKKSFELGKFFSKIYTKLNTESEEDNSSGNLYDDFKKRVFGHSLEMIICAGGNVDKKSLEYLLSLGYNITNGYYMTEVGITSINTEEDTERKLKGCLGKPFNTVEYKIVPFNNKKDITRGELLIKSSAICKGYLEDGELVEVELDEKGFFSTGDIVSFENESIYFKCRMDDVIIINKDSFIYPDEINKYFEDVLNLEEVAIIGVRNETGFFNAVLVIYVGDKYNNTAVIEQVAKDVKERMFKLPDNIKISTVLVSKNVFPKTSTNSINYKRLRTDIEKNEHNYIHIFDELIKKEQEETKAKKSPVTVIENKKELLSRLKNEVRKEFSAVLGIPEEQISDEADFINELGGWSLSSFELYSRVCSRFKLKIPEKEFFENNNVEELSCMLFERIAEHKIREREMFYFEEEIYDKKSRVKRFDETIDYGASMGLLSIGAYYKNYFSGEESDSTDLQTVIRQQFMNFGTISYLDLASDPQVVKASKDAIDLFGTGSGASKFIVGERQLYKQLEIELCDWINAEDCLTYSSEFIPLAVLMQNYFEKNDLIIYDTMIGSFLMQAIKLSPSEKRAYRHNNLEVLEAILEKEVGKHNRILLVIEGIQNIEGDIAPIFEIVNLKKKYGFGILLDETNSLFVLGNEGRGLTELYQINKNDIEIRIGSLRKGLGTGGGFIAANEAIIDYLRTRFANIALENTINPSDAGAALKMLDIVAKDDSYVKKLQNNIKHFIKEAAQRKINIGSSKDSAIVSVFVGKESDVLLLSDELLKHGIYVLPVIYPNVPKNDARIKFTISAGFEEAHITMALDTISKVAADLDIRIPESYTKWNR